MRQTKASKHKQQRTDDVAKLKLGNLGDVFAVLDRDLAENEQQAQRLQDVGHMSCCGAPGPHCEIAIVASGKLVRIDAQVDVPDEVAAVASHEAEYGVKSNAWTPAQSTHREANAIWPENVGRDEIETSSVSMYLGITPGVFLYLQAPQDAVRKARLAFVHSSSEISILLSLLAKFTSV